MVDLVFSNSWWLKESSFKGGFQELEVWKEARNFRIELSALTKNFPDTEKFRLVDQLIRASRSVSANIAEGYGRFHYQENIQACRISRGSINELLDDIIIMSDEDLITKNQEAELSERIKSCLALTNGYINYLTKAKKGIFNHGTDNE